MKLLSGIILLVFISCSPSRKISFPERTTTSLSGTEFYKQAAAYNWAQRDSLALEEFMKGNLPSFLKDFRPVKISATDSATGKTIHAICYVSPDYFSIGNDDDWCRVPLTPMTSQKIADASGCFLPTRKLVNDIHRAATVKCEPVPMYAFRDSTVTMFQHHLIIEGQRKQQKGLISGIKKDVVISGLVSRASKKDRVAIYGWHKSDGRAIQPLYTGHVNWYVDYSHGTRLIYRKIKVGRKWMDYEEILKDPVLSKLLCDEQYCDFYKYSY